MNFMLNLAKPFSDSPSHCLYNQNEGYPQAFFFFFFLVSSLLFMYPFSPYKIYFVPSFPFITFTHFIAFILFFFKDQSTKSIIDNLNYLFIIITNSRIDLS
ncbi:hypothetical protein CROQUDRAFT_389139 [Cronartium quercuum f. sp. fusiforme G11]|uniref:Uncharacterized protein n=1 Tax=Cronartium quercuum f. sp. fusiforme G11 TaxID=708437 RepID=A0A9P6N5Y9_9BASI|nr:hypothetical protein CROQUDRAFT_389139 [Cronartium quercuum f. sp. fusiforme G11]